MVSYTESAHACHRSAPGPDRRESAIIEDIRIELAQPHSDNVTPHEHTMRHLEAAIEHAPCRKRR